MKYISGIHALNLRCSLQTCGDWHQSGIQWKMPTVRESSNSLFGDYGIEKILTSLNMRELSILLIISGPVWIYWRKEISVMLKECVTSLFCNDSYTPEIFKKFTC